MTTIRCALLGTLVLTAAPVIAAVDCHGVLEYDDDVVKGRFRCKVGADGPRRVRATCHDGESGCDSDGKCDGACRFALCADAACEDTVQVAVPLRRNKAKGKATFRSGRTRVRLRCLPPRGLCGAATTSTTTSTTSTTLPGQACVAMLTGAVEGSAPCSASLQLSALGLPVLNVSLGSNAVAGTAGVLLTSSAPGTYTAGHGAILAVLALHAPEERTFQAAQSGAAIEVRIDSVIPAPGPGSQVHGTIDTTLRDVFATETVRLQAEF